MKAAFSSAVDCDSTRQQHQQDQIEQQRNTSDEPPGEQRVAHRQWRCRRPLERSVGAALECRQAFSGGVEALTGSRATALRRAVLGPTSAPASFASAGKYYSLRQK